MSDKIFEVTGTILINGLETNITMFLDDDSNGHQLVSELVAKFEWKEIEESKPFNNMVVEKWWDVMDLGFIYLMVIILIFPISLGINALGHFIAERVRDKDKNKKIELEQQLSKERTEAIHLRCLQIEHGLTVTPNELLDGEM